MSKMERLTAKENAFVNEYIVCGNGTMAHERAGYEGDYGTHATGAWRLLKKEKILRAIAARTAQYAMPANETLMHLTDIARDDLADALNSMGGIDIMEAVRRGKSHLIKRYKTKVRTILEKDGTEREIIETEVEMYDRLSALQTLAKFHDLTNTSTLRLEDWRMELIKLIAQKAVTAQQVMEEFGIDVAQELFIAAGLPLLPSGES